MNEIPIYFIELGNVLSFLSEKFLLPNKILSSSGYFCSVKRVNTVCYKITTHSKDIEWIIVYKYFYLLILIYSVKVV